MTSNNSFQVFKGGWAQLENGVFTENLGSVDTIANSFFFKPDGRIVFVLHAQSFIEEHPLTIPWDIDTIQPAVNSFSVDPQGLNNRGLFFKDDGTKMFVTEDSSEKLNEFDLSTPWDISTAVFNGVFLDISAAIAFGAAFTCVFSTIGNIVFIANSDSVFSYPLNTNWDAGSNTIAPTSFTPPFDVDSVAFKPEGDKMYMGNFTSDEIIREFDLSSPFNIDAPVDTGKTLNVAPQGITTKDIFWRSNGTQFFVLSTTTSDVLKYNLESEWDISTASFFGNNFPVSGSLQRDVFWRPDGLIMFELDSTVGIKSYIATTPFNTSTLTATGFTFNVGADETIVQGMWWRSDGLRLFIVGNGKTVFQYTTSEPYSINPAEIELDPTDSFDLVPVGSSNPTGIFFSPNGRIMLISADNPQELIHQFNLTAPYTLPPDLTAANKILILPVAEDVQPRDVFVKADGLQMFIPTTGADDVARYTLTTPFGEDPSTFDITTAVLKDKLNVGTNVLNPQGISLSPDGKQLFIVDLNLKVISTCDLLLEFNNSIITTLGEDLITDTTTEDRLVYA